MSLQEYDEILTLFNPSRPISSTIPPINLNVVTGFKNAAPPKATEVDPNVLRDILNFVKSGENKQIYKKFSDYIFSKDFESKNLSCISNLKSLINDTELADYMIVFKSWTLFHFFERYGKKCNIVDAETYRKEAKNVLFDHNGNFSKEKNYAGSIAYALFLSAQNLLTNEHIPTIFAIKPRFTFELEPFQVSSGCNPHKKSKLPVIKRERLTLFEFSEKLTFFGELLNSARTCTNNEIQNLKKLHNSLLNSIKQKNSRHTKGNILTRLFFPDTTKPQVIKRCSTSEVKATLPPKEANLLLAMSKNETTTDSEYNFNIKQHLERFYSWLFPMKLYESLSKKLTLAQKLNSKLSGKTKFEKLDASHMKVLFPIDGTEPTEAQIERILGDVDFGIYLVCSSENRDAFNDISTAYYEITNSLKRADKQFYVSDIVLKVESVLHSIPLTNIRSYRAVNKIETELKSIQDMLSSRISDICITLTKQAENPTFISQYPVNYYENLTFPTIALGIGEMAVLKKRYVGWSYGGLTKIVNILGGISKEVISEIKESTTSTTVFENTETNEIEEERVSKTSKEINKEISKENNKQINASGGINVSSSFGTTKIDANAKFSFSMNDTSKENKNTTHSKELVSKAVKKIGSKKFESVRKTVKEEILNRETEMLKSDTDKAIVVMDINDVFEFIPIRYGKRLMVELYIPEPAIGFINQYLSRSDRPKKPEVFAGSIKDIQPEIWECLKEKYPEADIPMPPQPVTTVEWKWASTPVEEQNAYGELLPQGSVAVPPGYIPERVAMSISVQVGKILRIKPDGSFFEVTEENTTVEYSVAVGGKILVNKNFKKKDEFEEYSYTFDEEYQLQESESDDAISIEGKNDTTFANQNTSVKTIPISAKIFNTWDQACFINMLFFFTRSEAAIKQWRAQVYQEIVATDKKRMEDYYLALEEYNDNPSPDPSRIVSENDVRSQLFKWFTKAMLGKPVDLEMLEQNEDRDRELEPAFVNEPDYLEIFEFFESFDFNNLRYHPLDSSYGSRDLREFKEKIESEDFFIDMFVKAGACRVSVPITAGHELKVLNFLSLRNEESVNDKTIPELLAIAREMSNEDVYGSGFQQFNTLADLYTGIESNNDFVIGVGKLECRQDSNKATVDLSEYSSIDLPIEKIWIPDNTDIGRKLIIEGETYSIVGVDSETSELTLNSRFKSPNGSYTYLMGYSLIGEPWFKAVPSGETKIISETEWNSLQQSSFKAQFDIV